MDRLVRGLLAMAAVVGMVACSGGGGGDDIAAEALADTKDSGAVEVDAAPVDLVETFDFLDLQFDFAADLDVAADEVGADEVEVKVDVVDAIDVEEDEGGITPPTEVGKACEEDADCATDAGCLMGFCTAFCKTPGGVPMPGVCQNSFPESEWGTLFSCPKDMDVCMPGASEGKSTLCAADTDCAAQGLAGYVCGGAFVGEEEAVSGRCLPVGNRKPMGGACQKGDGTVCASLFCLHPGMDQGEAGICSGYCTAETACPAGSACAMYPVYETKDELLGYAALCVPIKGSLKACDTTADCKVGKEFCGVVIPPGGADVQFLCMEATNPQGGWLGDVCSDANQCFGPYCAFGSWANKVNAYCTNPCKTDADCSPQTQCRTIHVTPFEEITPDGMYTIQVCLKVNQGASCFVAEENVCKYEWSTCKPIPAGYGWLGTCEDGTCPPTCEGKACKEDDGCGKPCMDACLADGSACLDGNECLNGFCVDGVCCSTSCEGTCVTCNAAGLEGQCSPMPIGQDPEGECGPCMRCGGTGTCKPLGFGLDEPGECGLCQMCDGKGSCAPVTAGSDPAQACGACSICDGAGGCAPVSLGDDPKGDCEEADPSTCGPTGWCSGMGACEFWGADVPCSDAKCQGSTFFPPSLCNGAGGCTPQGGQPCAPYLCNPEGTDCRTSCTANADCVANNWCVGNKCEQLPACPMETKLLCNVQLPGTTFGLQNNWSAYDSCLAGIAYSGPERVYNIKYDKLTKVTATLTNAAFDSALFLLDTACSPANACTTFADIGSAGDGESLTFMAKPGVSYHLAVDSPSDADKGNFTISTQCCTLKCAAENACGDDGCGGSCGTCGPDSLCYAGVCQECAKDPGNEPNDTCEKGMALAAGTYKGMLLCPDSDMDWYTVDLVAGELLSVNLVFEKALVNLDLALYGPDCATLLMDSVSPDSDEHVEFTAKQAGTYRLLVYSPLVQQAGYDLTVTKTKPQCTADKDCPFGKVCGLFKCVTPPAPCQTVSNLACFAFVDGTLPEQAGKFTSYTACNVLSFLGPEAVYGIKLETETVVTMTLINQVFAGQVSVLEKYCAPTWGCVASGATDGPGSGVQFQFKAKANTQYYVVVDGATEADFGSFSLSSDCCLPQCEGKVCGADGCGMTCGTCPGQQDVCQDGQCVCVPDCKGKVCGDDGCGGSCGDCLGPQDACVKGQCECQPACQGKQCGDDGCGGECGTCPGPQDACQDSQCVCVPDCTGKACGDDGCGGSCGTCPGPQDACQEFQCVCVPSCTGKVCGDDGCGGSCGTCPGLQDACVKGQCVCQPACTGKKCGDDGCGGVCGKCSMVESCESFQCVCQSDNGFENNNTCAKATPITPATYPDLGICTGGDQDWYSIQLLAGQTLTVKASFNHALGDLDLYLYKQGNCVGYLASSSTSASVESISYTSTTQSTYLIRVVGYNASVSNAYSLEVVVK